MKNTGILIVVSGFSGAGKGTLMKRLLAEYDNYALSVSATTRSPREGEQDKVDYFFISKEEFETMIQEDALYEHAQYQENYYGTPRKYVDESLQAGKDVILEIEVQGAEKIKAKFPDTVLIFVTPPSASELKQRLVSRGTETQEKINGRLNRALEEARYMPLYDYILVNDELETCVKELHAIIRTEHMKSKRNSDRIANITEELKVITKGE